MISFFFGPAPILALQNAIGPEYLPWFRTFSFLGDPWGLLIAAMLARSLFGWRALYALLPLVAIEAVTFLLFAHTIPIERTSGGEVTRYEQLSMNAFPSGPSHWHRRRVDPAVPAPPFSISPPRSGDSCSRRGFSWRGGDRGRRAGVRER